MSLLDLGSGSDTSHLRMSLCRINQRSGGLTEQVGFSDSKMGDRGSAERGEAGFTECSIALPIPMVSAASLELCAVRNGD